MSITTIWLSIFSCSFNMHIITYNEFCTSSSYSKLYPWQKINYIYKNFFLVIYIFSSCQDVVGAMKMGYMSFWVHLNRMRTNWPRMTKFGIWMHLRKISEKFENGWHWPTFQGHRGHFKVTEVNICYFIHSECDNLRPNWPRMTRFGIWMDTS